MLNVLDLFSGIGGFSLGLERTGGFRTIAFCEIEPYCRAVLAKHWPGVPIYEDVAALTAERLGADGIAADVICGGFPCQDISLAGKGAGLAGERSGLWFEFHRLIDEIKPRYAIIENVSALRSRGLDVVLGQLAALGYDVEWHCIPASAVGAPHRRDRIWIVAYPARLQPGRPEQRAERERAGASGQSEPVAEAIGAGLEGRPILAVHLARQLAAIERGGEVLADAAGGGRLEECSDTGRRSGRGGAQGPDGVRPGGGRWWLSEPDVGRVAHGVPSRVDRLRALGNAVVPQIPEIIGRAIIAAEEASAAGRKLRVC